MEAYFFFSCDKGDVAIERIEDFQNLSFTEDSLDEFWNTLPSADSSEESAFSTNIERVC